MPFFIEHTAIAQCADSRPDPFRQHLHTRFLAVKCIRRDLAPVSFVQAVTKQRVQCPDRRQPDRICRCGLRSCLLGICRERDRREHVIQRTDPDTEPYSEPAATGTAAAAAHGKYPGVGDDSGYRTCIKYVSPYPLQVFPISRWNFLAWRLLLLASPEPKPHSTHRHETKPSRSSRSPLTAGSRQDAYTNQRSCL